MDTPRSLALGGGGFKQLVQQIFKLIIRRINIVMVEQVEIQRDNLAVLNGGQRVPYRVFGDLVDIAGQQNIIAGIFPYSHSALRSIQEAALPRMLAFSSTSSS